jgi:hypothetical protein
LLCFLYIVVAMWGVSCQGGDREKNKQTKNGEKNTQKTTQKQVSPSEKPMLIRRGADKRGKKQRKRRKKEDRGAGSAWEELRRGTE